MTTYFTCVLETELNLVIIERESSDEFDGETIEESESVQNK